MFFFFLYFQISWLSTHTARRMQRTKSRWPKGDQLEVGSQRSPRLLVDIRLPVFIIPVDLRHDANNIEVLSSIFLRGNSQVFSFIHLIQIFRWNTWKCFSFSQIAFVAVPSVFLYLSVLLKISRLFSTIRLLYAIPPHGALRA